jgi:hypothetical protein
MEQWERSEREGGKNTVMRRTVRPNTDVESTALGKKRNAYRLFRTNSLTEGTM